MRHWLLLAALPICLSLHAQADYNASVGARIGTVFGVGGKVFLTPDLGLEGYFGSRRRGYELGAAALIHRDLGWSGDFTWYYGGGTHLGFSEYSGGENSVRTQTTFGVAGQIGIEYTLQQLPLNLAIDYRPEFNFTGVKGFDWIGGALSVRYAFR